MTGPGGAVSGATDADGTVDLRLVADPWGLGERPLPLGGYAVTLDDGEVLLGDDLAARAPVELVGDRHRLTVRAGGNGRARLLLDDLRSPDEVGPAAQRRLQQEYAATTATVDPGLAYFQSYTGQHPTDSPLAIHQSLRRLRPDVRVRWGVDDPGTPVPEGAEPVLFRSREWYDTLARAHWIVTNIEMERWFRRRPGQELLQTWHGNPGKVMGLGLWRANGLTPGRIEQNLEHGPRSWTLLMSPSPEMTEHYRREFALRRPGRRPGICPRRPAARARRRAGAGRGAPTAGHRRRTRRPCSTRRRGATRWPPTTAPPGCMPTSTSPRWPPTLGPGHVVLLRGHRFHARHPERPRGARILDVTDLSRRSTT